MLSWFMFVALLVQFGHKPVFFGSATVAEQISSQSGGHTNTECKHSIENSCILIFCPYPVGLVQRGGCWELSRTLRFALLPPIKFATWRKVSACTCLDNRDIVGPGL